MQQVASRYTDYAIPVNKETNKNISKDRIEFYQYFSLNTLNYLIRFGARIVLNSKKKLT
jgi:hypothetical protein